MNRGVSWTFLGVSVAFFLFIVGLTGYRLEETRSRNSLLVEDRIAALATKVATIQTTYVGLDTPSARKELRAAFDGEPRLLLMSVHSPSEGMLYLVARNRAYLKEPAALNAQWRGTPVYDVTPGYEVLLSKPLAGGAESPVLDGEFIILGREDLYPIVRDDLYLFLAFLLVSGVMILIVVSVQEGPRERATAPAVRASLTGGEAASGREPQAGPGPSPPRTGLVWGEQFEPKLRSELERAVSAGEDLALARIRIDPPYADSRLPVISQDIAGTLLRYFPGRDFLFDTGIDTFALLIPDTDIDGAVKGLEAFRRALQEGRSLSIGVSSRAGRTLTASTLLEEADVSMAKASREGGNRVIGFRADPSRYRDNISAPR